MNWRIERDKLVGWSCLLASMVFILAVALQQSPTTRRLGRLVLIRRRQASGSTISRPRARRRA